MLILKNIFFQKHTCFFKDCMKIKLFYLGTAMYKQSSFYNSPMLFNEYVRFLDRRQINSFTVITS